MSAELEALEIRVGNGITWLTEHDPTGAFHLWFESGLTAGSPMPSIKGGAGRIEEWQAYYAQRVLWERLWSTMVRLEKAAQA